MRKEYAAPSGPTTGLAAYSLEGQRKTRIRARSRRRIRLSGAKVRAVPTAR